LCHPTDQHPETTQAPSSVHGLKALPKHGPAFANWNLGIFWNLDVGIWNFRPWFLSISGLQFNAARIILA
jgi:hypothetical protein